MTFGQRLVLHLGVLLLCAAGVFGQLQPAEAEQVKLTFYLPTGNRTANNTWPYSGSAACSYNFPFGTVLEFDDGLQVVCTDRGLLGSTGWVDVFVWSHAEGRALVARYGAWPSVSVVRWGYG